MTFNIYFYIAIILLSGILFGRLAKLAHLPNVTGYLVAGLIIGPFCLKLVPENIVLEMSIISNIAVGFMVFSIGSVIKLHYLKNVGIFPIIIAVFAGFGAMIFVTVGLIALGQDVAFSLIVGSIAAETAPGATIMVISQYKAKGPVTNTLMTTVAIDDAIAIIFFGFAVAIAQTSITNIHVSLILALLLSLVQDIESILLGIIFAILFKLVLRWFKKDVNRLIIICGFILSGIGAANLLGLSSLLTCMAMGAGFANISYQSDEIIKLTESITPPIFLMFFVVAGAELDIYILPTIGIIGAFYILLRVFGKIAGSSFGATITHAPLVVRKYVGYTLIPQAGVAIGLTLLASSVIPEYAEKITAVILCATLIFELTGPVITKIALIKSGEIERSM